MTAYGRRKESERGKSRAKLPSTEENVVTGDRRKNVPKVGPPRWVYVVGIHAVGLALLFLVLHVTQGGVPGH
jgi:hypothetical protein